MASQDPLKVQRIIDNISLYNGKDKSDFARMIANKYGYEFNNSFLRYIQQKLREHEECGVIKKVDKNKNQKVDVKSQEIKEDGSVVINIRKARTLEEWKQDCIVTDLSIYEEPVVVSNQWEMGAIVDGEAVVTPLYQLKVTLVPKKPKGLNYLEVAEEIMARMKLHSPKYPTIQYKQKSNRNLFILDPADSHFGKYCSYYETGFHFDLNTCEDRVKTGCASLIEKAKGYDIDECVLLFGNDVLHFDNSARTTTSGTRQDSDRMIFEIFMSAQKTFIELIDHLRVIYPKVHVMFNCSNHDYVSGWMLMQSISAWYRNCNNVTCDDSIAHRKYLRYGKNMITTSHGDGAKESDIPSLMAQERPHLWAETEYRYAYLHHIHHKLRKHLVASYDLRGVTIEYVRSLSEADSWHHRNGYSMAPKAIEGFIHEFDGGQVGRVTHYF